ncbi:restriction endonuclease subunit S [Neorhizobium sp. T25_13]|uniref:restriction endonuclease subunit S n=1 Tax=Neorhizobium sp. T25_13 TaxID=2093830 RepID=UPI000CF855DA|nr:restriction endonuclease subunit S [Neorhizobium sp. T25_13]
MSPDGWNRCRIGDIFTVARGGSPRPIDAYLTDDPEGINWVKIGDATASGKFIRTTKERIKPEGLSKTRRVIPGDFILSNSMSFGRPYIMAIDGCIHDGWLLLRPNDENSIDREFYFYLLGSDILQQLFSTQAAGSAVRNLNIDLVAAVEVQVPPLDEQRRIAEILSSVDEAIAATRAVIEQTIKVKQGVLERLLTKGIDHTRFKQTEIGEIPEEWPLTNADDVCTQISVGIVIKPSQYYVESGVRCFRSANVREGFVEDADWVYISEEGNRVNQKSVLRAGDVLVVRTGYPGTSCVVPPRYDGANCIDIIFARPKIELVDPYFLSTFINSASGKTQVLKAEGGLAQKHFNVGAMKQMKLPLPPLHEQHEIVAHIQEFASTEAALERILEQRLRLKSALMSDLLTGRKRVTDALPMAAE